MSTPITAVAVVSKTTLANGVIAVVLRTNDDPASDYSATIYVSAETTPADIQSWLAEEKTKAAALYDSMQAAHSTLASLM
jgi:hypothetical protein